MVRTANNIVWEQSDPLGRKVVSVDSVNAAARSRHTGADSMTVEEAVKAHGISKSEFYRRAVDRELAALAN